MKNSFINSIRDRNMNTLNNTTSYQLKRAYIPTHETSTPDTMLSILLGYNVAY